MIVMPLKKEVCKEFKILAKIENRFFIFQDPIT